jgi:hypothetical protein
MPSGTLTGTGALAVAPGAVLEFSGTAVHLVTQRQIENQGAILWSGGDIYTGGGRRRGDHK